MANVIQSWCIGSLYLLKVSDLFDTTALQRPIYEEGGRLLNAKTHPKPTKIAVISDIHGNLPALQAVTAHVEAWQPDVVVVNGDVISRGPLSRDCLSFVLEKQQKQGWYLLRGNHEQFVLECGRTDSPRSGPAYDVVQFAHWAYESLNGQVESILTLPDQFTFFAPDGSEFRVTHASMINNRDGLFRESTDEMLLNQMAPAPTVFVTAHTHQTFVRQVNGTLVVNVGSVGAPFDLDRRAGYGRFTWQPGVGWQADVVRLPYNWQQTEQDYVESGFLGEGGPLAQLMLVELRYARGLIYRWATRYQEDVLAGKVSLENTVRQLLQDEDLRPFLGPPGWT